MPRKHLVELCSVTMLMAAAPSPPATAADSDVVAPSAAPATAEQLQQVVISTTPLPGIGLPANYVPSNVQTANSKDMQRQQSLNLTDYMNNNFTGVSINESADNPFQSDINYHGFTASPLLGTPEGLSVYIDGVRVNEAFGDTVNWDVIPQSAISSVTLVSGSNPVFGLNTLGGALSLQTKNGHDAPGTELEASYGSFGRREYEGETGGTAGNFDYFLTGEYFNEDGWRQNGQSRVVQAFGKFGWQYEHTDLHLSYTYAETNLWGDGVTPQDMLNYSYETSYTPDFTTNQLNFVNLTGTQSLADKLVLSGNVYYRHIITAVNNGNINDDYLDSGDYVGPLPDCSATPGNLQVLAYCEIGNNALSRLVQSTKGASLQLTDSQDVLGLKNQAVLGGDFTDSSDSFYEFDIYGPLTPARLLDVLPLPFNYQPAISVGGINKIYGVYLTDTLSPSELLHFTGSLRYNSSTETIDGYSVNTGLGPGFNVPVPVSGDHTFTRLNPAFGFTVTPTDTQTYYVNYNESSRAPTVIELGCADPTIPCGLPNDFASDPNLQQVVARTLEVGARGNLAGNWLVWSGDVFRTQNSNDIQFVATSVNAGYFENVGSTRRQGLDLALGGTAAQLHWRVTYSLVDATYQSTFVLNSANNSNADAFGNIVVSPGDRIPLIPRNTARLLLDYDVNKRLNVGGNLLFVSGSYLHGNEDNANVPSVPNSSGWIPSYTLVNLQGTWRLVDHIELFARVVNVLDKRYSTAGFLTSSSFEPNGSLITNPNNWPNANAVSPGAPLGIWAGVRATF